MKLTDAQIEIVNNFIDERHINKQRLIEYLEKHATVKNNVFQFCAVRQGKRHTLIDDDYCIFMDDERGFCPVPRDVFIRRIPFLFSLPMTDKPRPAWITWIIPTEKNSSADELEDFYRDLEHMYYDLQLSLYDIFSYADAQTFTPPPPRKKKEIKTGVFDTSFLSETISLAIDREHELGSKEIFSWWRDYIKICETLGWTDLMPDRFISKYNEALEAVNREPIIYEPISEPYYRVFKIDNAYQFGGNFPCDKDGIPILRWTNIRVESPKSITFDAIKSRCGTMTVQFSPDTLIYMNYADDEYDENGNKIGESPRTWHQIYAGPRTMEFDYIAMKTARTDLGMTQKDVADAIGASVRTYQKWESGDTTPDGHYLLRIMNWLNIDDVQELIKYTIPKDLLS